MNRHMQISDSVGRGCPVRGDTGPHFDVKSRDVVMLPKAQRRGRFSLEEILLMRRSVREYTNAPLTKAEVGQLLWAAQGITEAGLRTAPSAGALYPLETYLMVGNVEGLATGVYKYDPRQHSLFPLISGDIRRRIAGAALGQDFFRHAACSLVLTAVYERTTSKYGDRGYRYVDMEAGHAAQNVCLQATALDLGCVPVGAFEEFRLRQILPFARDECPLYLLPVGKSRRGERGPQTWNRA